MKVSAAQGVNENARNCGQGVASRSNPSTRVSGGGSLDTGSLGPCSAWSAGIWPTVKRHGPRLDRLGADVALVQEAGAPPPELAINVVPDPAAGWETALPGGRPRWRTAVIRLSDRVEVRPRATVTLEAATPGSAVDDSEGISKVPGMAAGGTSWT
jgi:hypothetical protein